MRLHRRLGRRNMGRADAVVDVQPVRLDPERDHLGPELPQHLRRGAVGGAMGAVDHHPEPVEPQALREGGLGVFDIAAAAVVDAPGPADQLRLGQRDLARHDRLDLGLGLVGELEAVRAEELDAVVRGRIVAGRDHDAEIGPHRPGEITDRRGRHRPEQQDVHAGRGQPGGQRVLEHVAREARVLADHHAMRGAALAAEPAAGGGAEAQRQLGRHRMAVGATADPVRAEERPAHASPLLMPASPPARARGPGRRRRRCGRGESAPPARRRQASARAFRDPARAPAPRRRGCR